MKDAIHPGIISSEEKNLLHRISTDGKMIETILDDPEYAEDFKRRLIYEHLNYIEKASKRWKEKLKASLDPSDFLYITPNQ